MTKRAALPGAILVVALVAVWLRVAQEPSLRVIPDAKFRPETPDARAPLAARPAPASQADRGLELAHASIGESRASADVGEPPGLTLETPTQRHQRYFLRVLARDDRRPVAGASVELLVAGGAQLEELQTTLARESTNAEGLLELRLPSWKDLGLRVRA